MWKPYHSTNKSTDGISLVCASDSPSLIVNLHEQRLCACKLWVVRFPSISLQILFTSDY